jgi:hypothetical protein
VRRAAVDNHARMGTMRSACTFESTACEREISLWRVDNAIRTHEHTIQDGVARRQAGTTRVGTSELKVAKSIYIFERIFGKPTCIGACPGPLSHAPAPAKATMR